MKRSGYSKILRAVLGCLGGAILGGYLGLIVGGTLLGGFDIHEATGFEGYELTTYLGGILGGVGGIVFSLRHANRETKTDH